MSTLFTVLFTGVVWLANGDIEPAITRPAANMAECRALGALFAKDIADDNLGAAGPMRMSWHWDCRAVMNDSAAKSS